MSPDDIYRRQLAESAIDADPAQAEAVRLLDDLYQRLLSSPAKPQNIWSLLSRRTPEPITGLYLWGGVGRGKTRLMDLFFDALPIAAKRRLHFHRFMTGIHSELDRLKGTKDPLNAVADEFAAKTRILCLDEFQVWDIADAMILGRLLSVLFERGVTLVATSNCAPDDLYPNGLQRDLFLPAIERIKTHCHTFELDSGTDYRLRFLADAQTYYIGLNGIVYAKLNETFRRIAPADGKADTHMDVNGRRIALKRRADSIAWVDFAELCDGPRSHADYLELARCFHTLLISDVPRMNDSNNDAAKRFINLIDILYDHNVSLILSADAGPESLYQGQALGFEFRRTTSRLQEMQSKDWLGREHRCDETG